MTARIVLAGMLYMNYLYYQDLGHYTVWIIALGTLVLSGMRNYLKSVHPKLSIEHKLAPS